MSLSVQSRAENVATFRFSHVFLMETLARWVPTTAEMEVKILFGRHIWDLAQQADALGKRTYELRAPLQFSLRPSERYMRVLEDFAKTSSTVEKVQGFYDVVLPGLAARYQTYLSQTDRLLDEPTVRVVERVLGEFARMQSDRLNLLKDLPKLCVSDSAWVSQNAQLEASVLDMVEHRPVAAVA
jgi:hypothetical protein